MHAHDESISVRQSTWRQYCCHLSISCSISTELEEQAGGTFVWNGESDWPADEIQEANTTYTLNVFFLFVGVELLSFFLPGSLF